MLGLVYKCWKSTKGIFHPKTEVLFCLKYVAEKFVVYLLLSGKHYKVQKCTSVGWEGGLQAKVLSFPVTDGPYTSHANDISHFFQGQQNVINILNSMYVPLNM